MPRKTFIQKLTAAKSAEFFSEAKAKAEKDIANPFVELHADSFADYQEELIHCVHAQDFERVAVLASFLAQGS